MADRFASQRYYLKKQTPWSNDKRIIVIIIVIIVIIIIIKIIIIVIIIIIIIIQLVVVVVLLLLLLLNPWLKENLILKRCFKRTYMSYKAGICYTIQSLNILQI